MTHSGLATVEERTVTSNTFDDPTLRNDHELLSSIIAIQQEIATAELDLPAVMHLIAERTQQLTGASGAVIELVEGDELVYRAATGTAAPSLGLRLKSATSFSGLCVRTGEVLRCDDAGTDRRVNREACQRVGLRSMIVVPLYHHGQIVGVLKVLSSQVQAFGDSDSQVLQLMAGPLAAAMSRASAFESERDQTRILESILSSMGDGVVVADEKGRFTAFNSAAEKILGIGALDAGPETWAERYGVFLPDTVTPCPTDQLPLVRAIRGETVDQVELFIRNEKLPHGIWLNVSGRPLRDKSGDCKGGVVVFQDVTARKLAEQLALERTAQLEAANKELDAFSYSVSHDLRAPLRAIDGFSRILLEDHAQQFSQEAIEYLGLVRENTQQMGRLVDDLLNFSRLNRQQVKKRTVAPGSIVQKCIEELRGEQDGRRVEITIGDLTNCEADPSLLKQVWFNLLANAFKYTRKRETAHIEVGCQGDQPEERTYFVRDNGVGFDMQYAPKLFGVFQRLHRAEDYEGTGVGLAIVQRIVLHHGGRVWAEAKPDQGATFYFTLEGASPCL